MALKRNPEDSIQYDEEISVTSKAKQLFTSSGSGKRKAETKILTTFSIEPSFKKELEELFPARNPDLQRGGETAPSATRRVLQERRRHLLIPRRWFWR